MSSDPRIPKGERSAKYSVHWLVQRRVYLDGQRNSRVTRRMATERWVTLYAAKSLNWAGAPPPLWTAFSRTNQSRVAPARHAGSVTVF